MRIGMKVIVLTSIAIILVVGAIFFFYKPTYEVIYNGEFLGYVANKGELQTKINDYIANGDGSNNLALYKFRVCQNTKCVY